MRNAPHENGLAQFARLAQVTCTPSMTDHWSRPHHGRGSTGRLDQTWSTGW